MLFIVRFPCTPVRLLTTPPLSMSVEKQTNKTPQTQKNKPTKTPPGRGMFLPVLSGEATAVAACIRQNGPGQGEIPSDFSVQLSDLMAPMNKKSKPWFLSIV